MYTSYTIVTLYSETFELGSHLGESSGVGKGVISKKDMNKYMDGWLAGIWGFVDWIEGGSNCVCMIYFILVYGKIN